MGEQVTVKVTLEIPSAHGTVTDTVNPAGDPTVWPQPPYSPRTEATRDA